MPVLSDPDLEPWNIVIAVLALVGVIVVMVWIAVCFLSTKQGDEEDIESQQPINEERISGSLDDDNLSTE